MTTDAERAWVQRGTCAVCSEPIEGNGVYLRHAHADQDVFCGTGDGATATSRLRCECSGGPHGGNTCRHCRVTA